MREIVSRQAEEIHRLKQSNEWLQHELASVKNALNELIGAMTEKERMEVQRRRKALAGIVQWGDASRSTGTDLPVDANGFYAGNSAMAASMLGTIESVQAAVVAASGGAPAGNHDAHHGLHAKPPPGFSSRAGVPSVQCPGRCPYPCAREAATSSCTELRIPSGT